MVTALRERPLEKIYPYLIVDAIYTKVQEAGAVRSKKLLVALGVNGASLHRLIEALLIDIHEEWQAGRRYLSLPPEACAKPVPIAVSTNSSAA